MKILFNKYLLSITLIFIFSSSFAKAKKKSFKNELSISWGWNRAIFSKSDLHLKGNDYNFTLHKVVAKDRQSPFGYDPYFKLSQITIPQYNFRVGFFVKDNWQISIASDHMKYVMQQNQTVKIDGSIANSGTSYDGNYSGHSIQLKDNFLTFEHTDGLNYVNCEVRRMNNLYNFKKLKQTNWLNIDVNGIAGMGAGLLLPRTNTHLLNNNRYDQFHLAGYGLAPVLGLNLTFYQYFFLQGELKAGYINMPDIRTTEFKSDKASQHFYFFQQNISLGFKYRF